MIYVGASFWVAQAVVSKVSIYQKKLPDGTLQTRVFFHDWHLDFHNDAIGRKQQAHILKIAPEIDAEVVVEDPSWYAGGDIRVQAQIAKFFSYKNKKANNWRTYNIDELCQLCDRKQVPPVGESTSFLSHFIKNSKSIGVRCANVEFRQAEVMSGANQGLLSRLGEQPILASVAIQETEKEIANVKRRLHEANVDVSDFEQDIEKPFKAVQNELSVYKKDSLAELQERGMSAEGELLFDITDSLIECNMVAKLASSEESLQFYCAGGDHCKSPRVKNILKTLRFKLLQEMEPMPNFEATHISPPNCSAWEALCEFWPRGIKHISHFDLQPAFDFVRKAHTHNQRIKEERTKRIQKKIKNILIEQDEYMPTLAQVNAPIKESEVSLYTPRPTFTSMREWQLQYESDRKNKVQVDKK